MLGLTNSPIIGYNCSFDFDDGNNLLEGDCYWFPNYQIENPFETLLNKGSVIFLLGE
jgi:hypothetical protein